MQRPRGKNTKTQRVKHPRVFKTPGVYKSSKIMDSGSIIQQLTVTFVTIYFDKIMYIS